MSDTSRRTIILAAVSALAATPIVAAGASSSDGVGDEIPPEYFTLSPLNRDLVDRIIRELSIVAAKRRAQARAR